MKLCILGNSHIASLKAAWDNGLSAAHPNTEITFFGARRHLMLKLVEENGRLVAREDLVAQSLATTSGGATSIDPSVYDSLLVYGLSRNTNLQVGVLADGYSRAVREQAITDYWDDANLLRLLKKLRRLTDTKIYAGHSPLEAATSDPTRPKGRYADYVALSNDLVFRDLNAELIAQPEATVVNGMGTDAGFSAGSTRLAVGKVNDDFEHREEENRHMNAEFGGIWLQAFLARL